MSTRLSSEQMYRRSVNGNQERVNGTLEELIDCSRYFDEDWFLTLNPIEFPCLIKTFKENCFDENNQVKESLIEEFMDYGYNLNEHIGKSVSVRSKKNGRCQNKNIKKTSKQSKNQKVVSKRSNRRKMSPDERRVKKNEAVRRHRAGIKHTIESCEEELLRLKQKRDEMDEYLVECQNAIKTLTRMQESVNERIEKEKMRKEPRPVVRRCARA